MLRLAVTCVFLLYWGVSIAQKDVFGRFINEYQVSANNAVWVNPLNGIRKNLGGGIGLYRSFREDKIFQPVIGVDYNFTRFLMDSLYVGDGRYYTDAHFRFQQLSFPVTFRIYPGKKSPIFIEPGFYFHYQFPGHLNGFLNSLNPDFMDGLPFERTLKTYSFLSPSIGIGGKIPCNSGCLILKAELRRGSGHIELSDGPSMETPIYFNSYLRYSLIWHWYARKF